VVSKSLTGSVLLSTNCTITLKRGAFRLKDANALSISHDIARYEQKAAVLTAMAALFTVFMKLSPGRSIR
jgi:hypothetical protein